MGINIPIRILYFFIKYREDGNSSCRYFNMDDKILNQIQKIRERNNKNWIDILRLAFKYAPKEAQIIMANIGKCDEQINKLTKKLTEKEKT
jgi:hypothetical protein